MEQIEITAKLRPSIGKSSARKCRKGDIVPAVCYGKGSEPVHIEISTTQVKKAITTPHKLNTIINLKITSDKDNSIINKKVLIKDVQKDALGKKVLHMDFIEVRDDIPVKVKVPIKLVGRAKGVVEGGILQQTIRELYMKCLPKDIPIEIEHDITQLGRGQAVHVKDLKIPETAKILVDKDRTVAVIVEIKEESAVIPTAAGTPSEAASQTEGTTPQSATASAQSSTTSPQPKSTQSEKK
ncbi:MAG: 50S ribosomal protein L25 [Deltaproteobacteria bacterium]|nr:50S ribosomal protein L25 [Deltaproteobacteria bacterium]